MLRMFARRMSQITTVAGTDQVIAGWSLPSETVIHDIRLKVQMVGNSFVLDPNVAHMYAVEGWILPVHDPDAAPTYDALWDQLVPKDTDQEVIDLDTEASDTSSFYEPGEAGPWSEVMDIGLNPERVYHRHKIQTSGNGARLVYQDTQTPFAEKWAAYDQFMVHVGKRLRVRQPSVLVFAIATPVLDSTTTNIASVLTENEWPQLKYASATLERALMSLFGLTEAGAETPWVEASALLKKHIDPDMYEETAGSWGQADYRIYTEAMLDHSVVGDIGKLTVSSFR